MKVLPVFPLFPPSFWSYRYSVELVRKKATMPPTGLVTVASMLPKDNFEVLPVADLNLAPLTDDQIKNADIVMASAMIVQRKSLEEVINRVHSLGKKVIVGGPYPTSYREEVKADHLVLDEAEVTLNPFLEDFLQDKALPVYDEKSVLQRRISTPLTKGGKPVLANTPVPRWDLLDLNQYSSLAIQYSRGCPFNCDFCDITNLFGRESRTKSPEQMIAEVEAIYKTKWRGSIFVVDDNFIGNKSEVRKMLPVLTEWQKQHKYPFSFFTEASMDLASPANKDIREGMIEAGFDSVFLGIESDDPVVLNGMNKKQNVGNTTPAEKIKTIQEAGFEVTGGFIIGSDGEKPEVFDRIFNFIQESGVVVPMAGLLSALRGTTLYKRLELEGRLTGDTTGNNTHSLGFNFKTQLDEKFLVDGYMHLLNKLFDSQNFYDRCRVLASRRGNYHKLDLVDKDGVHAFLTLMYENTIKRPDIPFLKYFGEVALTNPSRIPEVITHAAKLRHFRTMTENTFRVAEYETHVNTLYEDFRARVEKIRGGAEVKLQQVVKLEQEVIARARKGYEKIHHDFREDAGKYFDKLRSDIAGFKRTYLPGQSSNLAK